VDEEETHKEVKKKEKEEAAGRMSLISTHS
jgi:hypothetical protein